MGVVRDGQRSADGPFPLAARASASSQSSFSLSSVLPLGSILTVLLTTSPASLQRSQQRLEAAAVSASSLPTPSAKTSGLSHDEMEVDRALRSLQRLLASDDEQGRAVDGLLSALQRQIHPLVPSLCQQLHFVLSFTFTSCTSSVLSHVHRVLSTQSKALSLRLLLALQFLTDRFMVDRTAVPPPLLPGVRGCVPPLLNFVSSHPSPQATVLSTTASRLLFSLLHLTAPTPLAPSFSSACRSLASSFSSTRPLLSSTLAAMSALPLPAFAAASATAQSSLFSALYWSMQPLNPVDITKRVSAAIRQLSVPATTPDDQIPSADFLLAVMALAASWVEVESEEEGGQVWCYFRTAAVCSLVSVWTWPRDRSCRALTPLVRCMLSAYFEAMAPRPDEDERSAAQPKKPTVAASDVCVPSAPLQARCAHILSLFVVILSTPRPLPSSLLRFLASRLLKHPELLSFIPRLFTEEGLESPSSSTSTNAAALLHTLYSQHICVYALLPPLVAAYSRCSFDLTPLFTALPFSSTLPPLIGQLLSDDGRNMDSPFSIRPLIDTVVAAAEDHVAALLVIIDAVHNFSSTLQKPVLHPGRISLSAAARPSLSVEHRAHLLHFVDLGLSLPAFTSSDRCPTAIEQLLRHLASYPSSSLHLSIVTHLQSFLEGSPAAREAVARFCLVSINERNRVQLHGSLLDTASVERVRSSLLFIQLFPVLVLRSLYSPLFTGHTAAELQPTLLAVLMEAMAANDSPQLKTVIAEVVARLEPFVVLPAMLREVSPVSAFILSSAFAYYTALNQGDSSERVEERRLLFHFDAAQLTAALQGSTLASSASAARATELLPHIVAKLLHLLSGPAADEAANGRLRYGVVDALSNVLVASSSYHRIHPTAPFLLAAFLHPSVDAVERKEERKERKEDASALTASAVPLSVRLSLLHVIAYALSRLGSLQLRAKEEQRSEGSAAEARWLDWMLDDWTSACVTSLVPFFTLADSGEEQSLVLRILFTAAYQRPSLARRFGPQLMAIARSALGSHAQIREVEEGPETTAVAREKGDENEDDEQQRQLGALKLLGCLLAHSPDSVVEGEPRLLFELRNNLQGIVKTRSSGGEVAQLAAQLLTLSGMG